MYKRKIIIPLYIKTPHPCFCYDTSTEDVGGGGGLGPGLDVVFRHDRSSQQILLHLIRIQQPEIGIFEDNTKLLNKIYIFKFHFQVNM